MAYNLNLDFSNMFGAKKKEDDDDQLLGNVAAQPEELASGPTGNVQPQANQPRANQPTQPMNDPDFQLPPADAQDMAAGPQGAGANVGELANNPLVPDMDNLPQSMPGDGPTPPYGPFTYEQTYIDPYIQNTLDRDYASLDEQDAASAAADVTQTAGYDLQDQSRTAQQSNLEMLRTLASGEPSKAIEAQRERGIQTALATAASMRGAPASAVQRNLNAQMAEVNRQAMEAGAQQQLEAQGMVNEFASQMRAQDMSIVDMQANFQQQANMTDVQMEAARQEAQATINSQLEAARGQRINELIGMGVDRNVAMLQISNEMNQLEKELNYKYWAGKTGSIVEMAKLIADATGATEDMHEQFQEEAGVFNIFGDYAVPEGYSAPDVHIIEDQGEGYEALPYTSPGTGPEAAPSAGGEYVWNFETKSYDWVPGPGSEPEPTSYVIPSDDEIISGAEAKQNVTPIGQKDEMFRTREANPFGHMQSAPELRGTLDPTNPNARLGQMRSQGRVAPGIVDYNKLGEVRQGLLPSYEKSQQSLQSALDAAPKADDFSAGYQEGKSNVRDYMDYGTIGYLGGQLVSGDDEEQERAGKQLVTIGIQKAIQGGVQGIESMFKTAEAGESAINAAVGSIYGSQISSMKPMLEASVPESARAGLSSTIDGIADGVERTVAKEGAKAAGDLSVSAGTGVAEAAGATADALEAGAAKAATGVSPWAPVIGGGVQFGSEVASGGEIAPALIRASAATAGGIGGAALGGKVGAGLGAALAPFTAGASIPVATAAGTAIGGGLGSLAGGAASAPIADAVTSMAGKRRQTPLGAIQDPAELVGAPTIFSGIETKLPDTIEGISHGIAPSYSRRAAPPAPSGYSDFGYQSKNRYLNSDENTKSSHSPVNTDELSSFLRDLDPVKYDYKPEYGGEKNQYGFIAQDAKFNGDGSVNPVGDSFVRQSEDGTHVIDTGKATMVNMAASANQQKTIDAQGVMLAELLRRQAMLEGRA
jgi:hypothetical protein